MNTNNVYVAGINRLISYKVSGDCLYNYRIKFDSEFTRITIVYQKSDGRFYDLLCKKYLNSSFDWDSEKGEEIVNVSYLTPFNEVVCQTKENLSKRKIKKLYAEHISNCKKR